MQLSAQTHFSQGWNTNLLKTVASLNIDMIRDGVSWNQVETRRGTYTFEHQRVTWVDDALKAGLEVMLVFQPVNDLYDNGDTVYSQRGVKAFADFVVATLKAYPGVSAIEIGNEFNGNDFVSGRVARGSREQRADYYEALVEAVDTALQAARIDVTIVGASTHSIPVDYFAALKQNGALDHVDAISIHPYTTDPEQFAAQLAVLRATIGEDTAIHVTEFGALFTELSEAPAYLAKMVSVMAAAGVASANWYALADQHFFPNMELWDRSAGKATPGGETFRIIETMLAASTSVERVAIDSHTYLYTFGTNAAILWGEARAVTLARGVKAYDLAGREIRNFAAIDPDQPVILRSAQGIDAGSISFAASTLVADSFHDFDLTNFEGSLAGVEGPWSYFAQRDTGQEIALQIMGGGLRAGEPWVPYLGVGWLRPLQMSASSVTPVDFSPNRAVAGTEFAVVDRFTASRDGTYGISGRWDVFDSTVDGVLLTIEINDRQVLSQVIFNRANGHVFDLALNGIELRAGDTIDFAISSRRNAAGDVTERRIQIFDQSEPETADAGAPPPVADPPAAADPLPPPSGPDLSLIENRFDESAATERVVLRGTSGNDALYGGSGDDVLDGSRGSNVLSGGAGDDLIMTNGTDLLIDGGPGRDTLIVKSRTAVTIDLAAASIEIARGGTGHDTFDGSALTVDARLHGGGGNDTLIGGSANDLLFGEAGNDRLYGGAGEDRLVGGAGNDILDGGAGNDRLEGGAGSDIFRFTGDFGRDVITDFGPGDRIDLSAADGAGSFAELAITYTRGRAIITIEDNQIVLLNVARGALDAGDFLF